MFESCCGGARSENNGTKKVISATTEIDETTDGISLGNGWQRWVDFEERRYYYSKGGTTTWEAPSEEDLIEEENKTKGKKWFDWCVCTCVAVKEGGKRIEFKTKIGAADLIIVDGMTMTESGSEKARRFVIIITTIILLL